MTASSGSVYRDARRAFIAAAEAAHVDTIARLHPSRDKDGKPLFMDSAALGPRLGTRAVLAIAANPAGSALAVELLNAKIALPPDGRVVMVHTLDPAAFAGVPGDLDWPAAMLAAVVTEDLSCVDDLLLLPLSAPFDLERFIDALRPCTAALMAPPMSDLETARDAIIHFFGG